MLAIRQSLTPEDIRVSNQVHPKSLFALRLPLDSPAGGDPDDVKRSGRYS